MTTYKKISYQDAIETTQGNKGYAKWPSRRTANRLEPEAWPQMRPSFRIQPGSTIFTIGSCFARNIENYFHRLGFHIPTLEFKVPLSENFANIILNKYTPPAIYADLEWTARVRDSGGFNEAAAMEKLIALSDDTYVDANLVGFNPVTRARAIERRGQVYDLFLQAFSADVVTITLGLIETWWDNVAGRYIETAPSRELVGLYPDRFDFRVLSYEDSRDFVCKSIDLLNAAPKRPNILLTTSPIPLERTFTSQDVLIANNYSKSLLRTVAGYVSNHYDNVDYFPSYEIVTMTKSPTIFIDDLIHVTEPFIGRIVVRVYEAYVDQPAEQVLASSILHARAACATGDLEPARALVRRDVDQFVPQRVRSSYSYVKARVLTARGETGLKDLLDLVDHEELLGHELTYLGRMRIANGDPAGAVAPLRRALADVDLWSVGYLINNCWPYVTDPVALLDHICDSLDKLPLTLKDSLAFWMALGVTQLKRGDIGEAWKALKNARTHAPADRTVARMVEELESQLLNGGIELRIAHAREQCWHENLDPARALLAEFPPDTVPQGSRSPYTYLQARVLTEDGDPAGLPELLERIDVSQLDGGLELLFYGKMHSDAGNAVAAEAVLRNCIRLHIAELIACQLLITRCLDESADREGLMADIQSGMAHCRSEEAAAYWFTLALLQQHTGEHAAARDSARRAAELEPDHSWYVGLARSLAGSAA